MRKELVITGLQLKGPPNTIFFRRQDATIDDKFADKLQAFLLGHQGDLVFHGLVSDDEYTGHADQRQMLGRLRAQAVELALRQRGWSGTATIRDGVSTAPVVDSRLMRKVVIKPLVVDEPMEEAEPPAEQPAPTAFEDARKEAARRTNLAKTLLLLPSLKMSETAQAVFGADADPAQLAVKVASMAYVLDRIREEGKPTDLPLEAPQQIPRYCYRLRGAASRASTRNHGDEAVMTFGPIMAQDGPDEQVATFIHEAAHAATEIKAEDRAYAKDRLFPHLSSRRKYENADHYRSLVEALASDEVPAVQTAAAYDDYAGDPAADWVADVGAAIGHAEAYLTFGRQEVERVHRYVWQTVYKNEPWRAAYTDSLAAVRKYFPGDFSLAGRFTTEDVNVLAGIHDHLESVLSDAVRRLTVAGAAKTWFDAKTTTLQVGPRFRELSRQRRVSRLIEECVIGVEGLNEKEAEKYADLLDWIAEDQGNQA